MIKKYIALCLIVLLSGCSSSSDDTTLDVETDGAVVDEETFIPASGGGESGTITSVIPIDLDSEINTSFDGVFGRSCFIDSGSDPATIQLTIGNGVFISELIEYADDACTQPINTVSQTFSVIFTGGTTETSLGVADHIDLTLEAFTFAGEEFTEDLDGVPVMTLLFLDEPLLFFGDEDSEDIDSTEMRPTELETTPFTRL